MGKNKAWKPPLLGCTRRRLLARNFDKCATNCLAVVCRTSFLLRVGDFQTRRSKFSPKEWKFKCAASAAKRTFMNVFFFLFFNLRRITQQSTTFTVVLILRNLECARVCFFAKARGHSRDSESSRSTLTSGPSSRHPSGGADCYQRSPEEMGRSGGRRRRGPGGTSRPVTSEKIKITIGHYCMLLKRAHVTAKSIWSH